MLRHFDHSFQLLAFHIVQLSKHFVLFNVKFDVERGIFVLNFDVLEMIGERLDYWLDGDAAVGKELNDAGDGWRLFVWSDFDACLLF